MKKILIFTLLVLFSNNIFGQVLDRNKEVEKIFLGLPIDTNLTILLNIARANEFIKEYIDIEVFEIKDYFTGYFSIHDYFKLQPHRYQIEIYTSEDYGIAGQILDSILVVAIYANYGNVFTKDIVEQYEELIKRFKELSTEAGEFQTHAESGKVSEGFYFFRTKEEKVPYLTISLCNGGCIKDYSIKIMYNRVNGW